MAAQVPPFSELIAGATTSAMHLEMRDVYAVTDEADDFEYWRSTGSRRGGEKAERQWRPWTSLVEQAVSRGVRMRRARVVSEPVSDYIAFEHAGTGYNVAAGELVRWLPRHGATDLLLPCNDFWVLDERLIRFGYFAGDGSLVGHELVDDPGVIKLCTSAFEAAWERGIDHEDYQIA